MIKTFLKLGFFAFGGPAAHIAMLEDEAVTKHGWLTRQEFLDLNGLTNIVPGPNSSEMVLGVGYTIDGYRGLIISGLSFMLPAIAMVLGLSYVFTAYQDLEFVALIMRGMKPVLFIMVFQVFLKFYKQRIQTVNDHLFLVIAIALKLIGLSEIMIILIYSFFALMLSQFKKRIYSVEPISLMTLFLLFLKIGATLYGSGYVLFSYLETSFSRYISNDLLINAMLIGELTPGPIFTTATAVGVFLRGLPGGIVATVGIFLPSFVFMMILMPLHEKIKEMVFFKVMISAINIAVIGLLFLVLVNLGIETMVNFESVLITIVVSVLMIKFKLSNYLVLMIAPVLSLLLHLI